ncbi:MAG: 23S rRNA (guanosine(2251)-2'-O)-methyltransferase RlmB [Bacillota bacterium]|jgi:23S rRNA (guanosine2251-2'-O)-methyltransferase|nr:23S rRNA (guanosine(2251)-2'-O)-methyltransferase RlmB [Bacillota bacterium]HHU31031.1 23S rRNA (guanosine(2251)-2'-O)-methyltransferase RlmB [Bacillota bacterium]
MEDGMMIAGRRPVLETLKAGTDVRRLFLQKGTRGDIIREILDLARERNLAVSFREKSFFSRHAPVRNHQGVMAEVQPFRYASFEQLLENKGTEPLFLLILDHIQDPQNLGALVRTAYAAGCHGLILPERRAAEMTPAAIRAAVGAAEHLPVARVVNLARCLDECKAAGLWVYGADAEGKLLYTTGDYKEPVALVIGSEGKGLSRLVREKCDFLVRLPMKGKLSSLNAAAAGAVLCYEVLRQREGL